MSDPVEWRPVPGLPAEYEVSSTGEMRRLARVVPTARGSRAYPPTILTGFVTDKGCRAYRGGFPHITAHRAVALAFLGPAPDGYEVRHIDGDKLNNHVSNLRYAPPNGGTVRGSRHPKTHLTDDDVHTMRGLYWTDGLSVRELARRFSISHVTAWQIVSGTTWTHIPMPPARSDIARENAELHREVAALKARLAGHFPSPPPPDTIPGHDGPVHTAPAGGSP